MGDEYISEALSGLVEALGNPRLEPLPGENVTDTVLREATRRILSLPRVPWQQSRVIATMPNTRLTPQVCLARTLEKSNAGKIESVYIGVQWADSKNQFVADWSSMPSWALSVHARLANRICDDIMFGGDGDIDANSGGT